MNKVEEMYRESGSAADYAERFKAHMASVIGSLDTKAVAQAADLVAQAVRDDKTVFFVGNGGSGAVAGHWVNDLSANTVKEGQPGIRAMSLTDNAFSVTALANDASYEEIFEIQLKANMRPGDVVVAMSVSGNSPNIIRAVEYANTHGAKTIGCCGFDGGRLAQIAGLVIHTPSTKDEYGPVEDTFSIVMHIIQSWISMERGRFLAH